MVVGRGVRGFVEPNDALDCGNSGTTTRLLAGVAAGYPATVRFTGDVSLSRRPMARVARPLTAMGASVELEGGHLPMTIRGGTLAPLRWATGVASAQVKSAILLAGLVGGVPVQVTEPSRSRDHTERMLARIGATVVTEGTTVTLEPVTALDALDVGVPGDPSSAAFFVALAGLADGGELVLRNVALNETRTGFVRAVRAMGAAVEVMGGTDEAGERVGDLRVGPATLRSIAVTGDDVPAMIDELPMLACLAARARGTTVIRGARELRLKESDRISALVSNLRTLGVDVEELPDGLAVTGGEGVLRGRVATHGDHRIAMAFGVLSALRGSDIDVDDRECVSVSYPRFWEDLERVVVHR